MTLVESPQWIKDWACDRKGGNRTPKTDLLAQLGGTKPAYLLHSPQVAPDLTRRALEGLQPQWSEAEESRIRELLRALPLENYDQWVGAGMICYGLHWDRSDGTSIGFDLWDEASQKCETKYSLAACEAKWPTFGRTTVNYTLGVGTLVLWAREADAARMALEARPINTPKSVHNDTQPNGVQVPLPAQLMSPTPIQFKDFDRFGKLKSTCLNTRLAIQKLGIVCRYDEFHIRAYVGGHSIGEWAGEVSDDVTLMVRALIREQFGFDPGKTHADDATRQECLAHSYDPVKEYLERVQWDGVVRLPTWMRVYLGADPTPFNESVSRLALIAAVRRVYNPGAKFDQMIVMESVEGRGKSSAIEILAGEDNFSDQPVLSVSGKEQQEQMEGRWLYEVADLVGIGRAEVESLKAFISRRVDRARPAFGRHLIERPRRCIFFGSTNNTTYLKSPTGNRRFWPVPVGKIALDALARDRDQLWAEAVHAHKQGGPLFLPETLWSAAAALQEARRDQDPWDDTLSSIAPQELYETADGRGQEIRVSTKELLGMWLALPIRDQTDAQAKRLSYAMQRLGWQGPKTMRIKGELSRGYHKGVTGVPPNP